MEILKVKGGNELNGEIKIGGAKNSAVALVPAAILSNGVVIENVPEISDVRFLEEIVTYLGGEFCKEGSKITIDSTRVKNREITLAHSQRLRASYYFMGALLGKFKRAEMYFPGGCQIGTRPINLHLEAFEKLGATVSCEDNKFVIEAKKLVGTDIDFAFASVGATINTILAAVLAEGITTINNAAMEPEIGNLIDFLNSMGAKITGKDTGTVVIEGVKKLSGGSTKVIPDRIEAGTYILAGALAGNNLKISDLEPKHLESFLDKLKQIGVDMVVNEDNIVVSKSNNLKPVDIITETYPGFPTDLQQPITSLLLTCNGESTVKETIYENRFQNIKYLQAMGADIKIDGDTINIKKSSRLKGNETMATDLRAGAGLILAGLIAEGETTVTEARHVLRGYENIIRKLTAVGVEIELDNV